MKKIKWIHVLACSLMLINIIGCTKDENMAENDSATYTPSSDIILNTDINALNTRLQMNVDNTNSFAKTYNTPKSLLPPPAIPANAIDLLTIVSDDNTSVTIGGDKDYVLKKEDMWEGKVHLSGKARIYIEGKLTVQQIDSESAAHGVYWNVLPEGELVYYAKDGHNPDQYATVNYMDINCWGAISFPVGLRVMPSSNIYIFSQYQNKELEMGTELSSGQQRPGLIMGGTFYCERDLWIKNGARIQGGMIRMLGETLFVGDLTAADNISSIIWLENCATISGDIKLQGATDLLVFKYLKFNRLWTQNKSNIQLKSNAYLTGNDLFISKDMRIEGIENYSRVECKNLWLEEPAYATNGFSGKIDVHYHHAYQGTINNAEKNKELTNLQWAADVLDNSNQYIEANNCHPAYGSKLKLIATLQPPHSETLDYSATSIDFNGSLAYISWHSNPKHTNRFGGVIDVMNITQGNLLQSLENKKIKYNHTFYYGNMVYTAGTSNERGALLSEISVSSDGQIVTPVVEKQIQLTGTSGNCVTIIKNDIVTASGSYNGSFDIFPINANQSFRFIPATMAKYVYNSGKYIVTLNDTQEGVINVYNTNDATNWNWQTIFGTPLLTIKAGNIEPADGKNVCICDDERIYVCMGENGLKVFSLENGSLIGSYDIKQVNGVDVDDQFIYIANGFGITVLQKTDLSYVASFTDTEASANFVRKGKDGLIYVAYGQKGVRVFSLQD